MISFRNAIKPQGWEPLQISTKNSSPSLRVLVKRILRKHGYPPDKQEKATQTVLEQAEVLSEIWAGA
jgi:type I restriction enzyme R subunit